MDSEPESISSVKEEFLLNNLEKGALAAALLAALTLTPALAANQTAEKTVTYANYTITVDGQLIRPTDVNGNSTEPFAMDNSIYVPVRAVSQALGCAVDYENGAVLITTGTGPSAASAAAGDPTEARQETKTVTYAGYKIMVDGVEIVPTDVNGNSTEPFAIEGSIYVPVRAVSQALGCTVDYQDGTVVITTGTGTSAGDPNAMDVVAVIENDGDATKITALDSYFNGNALQAVEALLDAGKFCVNGIPVPATEDEIIVYQVNQVDSIYKGDSGWGYNVHKTTSANNLTFAAARLGFAETVTTVRGHTTTLYGDAATGRVNKVDVQSFDVVRVTDVVYYNESITVVRGDFDLETERVRPDVNQIIFHNSRFDMNIAPGDFALYYYGPDGWVIQKAESVTGKLSKNEAGNFVVNAGQSDAYEHVESNVSRYNLMPCNRPSQFYSAYVSLGLTDLDVVTWLTPTGHPIGFTYGDKAAAKAALTQAIANAAAAKDGVVVSENGGDVAQGTRWVTQEAMDAYDAALSAAQAVCSRNSTPAQGYDQAIYDLAQALGQDGQNPSGFLGAQGEGTK